MTTPDQEPWLDAALGCLPKVEVPAELSRTIAQIPITHEQSRSWGWLSPRWVGLGYGLCGALGVVYGWWVGPTDTSWVMTDDAAEMVSAEDDGLFLGFLGSASAEDWESAFAEADLNHAAVPFEETSP